MHRVSRTFFLWRKKLQKSSEQRHWDKVCELMEEVLVMASDNQHPPEKILLRLNHQIDARQKHTLSIVNRDDLIQPLEEKMKSLEGYLYSTKPEIYEKLQKLNEVEHETEQILSEIKKRDKMLQKLSVDLQGQVEMEPRRLYIDKIKEITKNCRKQDADMDQVLKETRELQLESNCIQERLHRNYAVLDETAFREAKKDPMGQRAYRLIVSIHEHFQKITEKILATDRIRREASDYEARLAEMAYRSLNVSKLQADLDAIISENKILELRLNNDRLCGEIHKEVL